MDWCIEQADCINMADATITDNEKRFIIIIISRLLFMLCVTLFYFRAKRELRYCTKCNHAAIIVQTKITKISGS